MCLKWCLFVCHFPLHRLLWINSLCNCRAEYPVYYLLWEAECKHRTRWFHAQRARGEWRCQTGMDIPLPRQTQQAAAGNLDYNPQCPASPSPALFHQSKIFQSSDLKILFPFQNDCQKHCRNFSFPQWFFFPHNRDLKKCSFLINLITYN